MSRRFGRNQKRRAREEAARLQDNLNRYMCAYQMADGLSKEAHEKLEAARNEIMRAKSMLPRGSVLFSEKLEWKNDGPRRERLDANFHDYPSPDCTASEVVHQSERLYALLTDASVDSMRRAIHFSVRFAGDDWCYAATEQSLRTMTPEIFVERISRELATQMLKDLVKTGVCMYRIGQYGR